MSSGVRVRGSTAEGSRRGDKDDQVATRSPHGVGTPIDFNCACARAARAFIPSRYVLTSFPGRFSTLHPSCQYSSICASVSADPRASLPCALHAAAIRRTAALAFVTELWGWQGLYFFDITWGLTFLVLAWRFLRPASRAMRLSEIDWLGYVILAVGLAALI